MMIQFQNNNNNLYNDHSMNININYHPYESIQSIYNCKINNINMIMLNGMNNIAHSMNMNNFPYMQNLEYMRNL